MRLLLSHIFSNLLLKDGEVAYTLKAPVKKLAERLQQRLDSEKTLELSNVASNSGESGNLGSLHPALCAGGDSNSHAREGATTSR